MTWADALERMALAALDAVDPATTAGRGRSDRYQVLVHVRPGDTLASNLHLGPALSAATRRRLTCDADVRWVLEEEEGPGLGPQAAHRRRGAAAVGGGP